MTHQKTIQVSDQSLLLTSMASKHGLIIGSKSKDKSNVIKLLTEGFSKGGVPVFMANVNDQNHLSLQHLPIQFWDIWGNFGSPMRMTVSQMGPIILSQILDLNDIQSSILNITFKIADDEGLLLLDLKDLQSMLNHLSEHSKDYRARYGDVNKSSISAIQRALLTLESHLNFGEPSLEIQDLFNGAHEELGLINCLYANQLIQNPRLYATYMLWLLSEIYESISYTNGSELPQMVFFFDEAHLLFKESSKSLTNKLEQLIRLIGSKGIGIFFSTHDPTSIPESIINQLENKFYLSSKAFTPREKTNVRLMASHFRENPLFSTEEAILTLKSGQILTSFLDENGHPSVVIKSNILRLENKDQASNSQASQNYKAIHHKYSNPIDRKSAYEVLKIRAEKFNQEKLQKNKKSKTNHLDRLTQSMVTTIGRQLGNAIARGLLGSMKRKK